MFLTPIIRTNRAIAACLIYPDHPIQAIAISEIASVIIPVLNPKLFPRILGTVVAMMYQPNFAYYYIKKYICSRAGSNRGLLAHKTNTLTN